MSKEAVYVNIGGQCEKDLGLMQPALETDGIRSELPWKGFSRHDLGDLNIDT